MMKVNKKDIIFVGLVGFLAGIIVGCNKPSIEAGNGFIGEEIGSIDSSTNVSGRIGVYKFTDPNTLNVEYIIVESDKGISIERAK